MLKILLNFTFTFLHYLYFILQTALKNLLAPFLSGEILTGPLAGTLSILPFQVLCSLFDSMPVSTDDGMLLRQMTLDLGVLHLILVCLSVLSHHAPRVPMKGFMSEVYLSYCPI